jgi:hypothetical protein
VGDGWVRGEGVTHFRSHHKELLLYPFLKFRVFQLRVLQPIRFWIYRMVSVGTQSLQERLDCQGVRLDKHREALPGKGTNTMQQ